MSRAITCIIGCGVLFIFGVSTWFYPINPKFGMIVCAAAVTLYVIMEEKCSAH